MSLLGKFINKNSASTGDFTEADLKKMSVDTLYQMHSKLLHVIPIGGSHADNVRIPYDKRMYGCKTYGEASRLFDLVAKVHNEKLDAKKEVTKSENIEEWYLYVAIPLVIIKHKGTDYLC